MLSTAADRAKEDATKIELSYRAGAVIVEERHQPERAFRSLRARVLRATDPTDTKRRARSDPPLREGRSGDACRRSTSCSSNAPKPSTRSSSCSRVSSRLPASSFRTSAPRPATRGVPTSLRPTAPLRSTSSRRRRARRTAGRASSTRSRGACSRSRRPPRQPPPLRPSPHSEAPTGGGAPTGGKKKKKKKGGGGEDARESGVQVGPPPAADLRRVLELKLARVFAEELARPDDAIKVYQGAARSATRRTSRPRSRSEQASCVSSIAATSSETLFDLRAKSAPAARRRSSRLLQRVGRPRGGGVRGARARRGALPARARDRCDGRGPKRS